MSEEKNPQSASQVLMQCFEDFSRSEPAKVLVIYINEDDFVTWKSNNVLDHEKIGLMEVVKNALLRRQEPEDRS